MKTGKYSLEGRINHPHFGEKCASLFTHFGGSMADSFESVARFTIVHQVTPLPYGLTAAVENDVIVAS